HRGQTVVEVLPGDRESHGASQAGESGAISTALIFSFSLLRKRSRSSRGCELVENVRRGACAGSLRGGFPGRSNVPAALWTPGGEGVGFSTASARVPRPVGNAPVFPGVVHIRRGKAPSA